MKIDSLRAQRQLGRATSDFERSAERLASGLRINRGSDDPAGLAVAARLQVNSRLYAGALRNTNDAISALSVAESALSTQVSILDRLRELATQAANGSFSATQRESLDTEYLSLVAEIGRQGETAEFNSVKLLRGGRTGTPSSLSFQVGIRGTGDPVTGFNLTDSGRLSGNILISADFTDGGGSGPADGTYDGSDLVELTNLITSLSEGAVVDEELFRKFGNGSIGRVEVNGSTKYVVFSGNADFFASGVGMLVASRNAAGELIYESSASFSYDSSTGQISGSQTRAGIDLGGLRFFNELPADGSPGQTAPVSALEFTQIDTQAYALEALDVIENRVAQLQSSRGQLGAFLSRLESAKNLLGSMRETTEAAASRIQDVDVASEAGALLKSRIQQDVASAVLAQANQSPALLLKLLQDS